MAVAESFSEQMRAIGDKYLGAGFTPALEPQIRADVMSEIFRLYAQGGFIYDKEGEPVFALGDVSVVVNVGTHSVSISAVPSQPWIARKLERRKAQVEARLGPIEFDGYTVS